LTGDVKKIFELNADQYSPSLGKHLVLAGLRQMLMDLLGNGFQADQEALTAEIFLEDGQ
jgi:hypothetical protein